MSRTNGKWLNFCTKTFLFHPETKAQILALTATAKALKVGFETEKSAYNPEFVKKILQGREDVKNGKGVKIAIKDLWN